MENNKKYSKYLVAYIDLLGTKNIFGNNQPSDDQLKLLNILSSIYDIANADMQKVNNQVKKCNLKINIFSDNVLIAIDYDINNSSSKEEQLKLQIFLTYVAKIQAIAFFNGYLLRGAITFGDLFIDDSFCIGPALIETYMIESEKAIYPRIITENLEIVENAKRIELLTSQFLKDKDGVYFLDFLNFFAERCIKEIAYKSIRGTFNEKFAKEAICKNLRNKIKWIINYYNNDCDKFDLREYKLDEIKNVNF